MQCLWLHAELIPANNTVVLELPATFYCRVTDTTGTISVVPTQWFINGEPADLVEGPFEVELPPTFPNNFTVISSFIPIRVSCQIPFYPNVDLGVFQVGECLVGGICKLVVCDSISCLCVPKGQGYLVSC